MWFLLFLFICLYFSLRREGFVVDTDKIYHSTYRSFVKGLPFRNEYRKLRRFLK